MYYSGLPGTPETFFEDNVWFMAGILLSWKEIGFFFDSLMGIVFRNSDSYYSREVFNNISQITDRSYEDLTRECDCNICQMLNFFAHEKNQLYYSALIRGMLRSYQTGVIYDVQIRILRRIVDNYNSKADLFDDVANSLLVLKLLRFFQDYFLIIKSIKASIQSPDFIRHVKCANENMVEFQNTLNKSFFKNFDILFIQCPKEILRIMYDSRSYPPMKAQFPSLFDKIEQSQTILIFGQTIFPLAFSLVPYKYLMTHQTSPPLEASPQNQISWIFNRYVVVL
jgi:hypothetical protein